MKVPQQNKSNPPIPPGLFQMAASLDDSTYSQTHKSKAPRTRKNAPVAETTAAKAHTARGRDIPFQLKAPAAKSVKLAADFTAWEKSPIKLVKGADGCWQTVVSLLPGRYAYRFIVDGQWWDDPGAAQTAPNPFGSTNALINVA